MGIRGKKGSKRYKEDRGETKDRGSRRIKVALESERQLWPRHGRREDNSGVKADRERGQAKGLAGEVSTLGLGERIFLRNAYVNYKVKKTRSKKKTTKRGFDTREGGRPRVNFQWDGTRHTN